MKTAAALFFSALTLATTIGFAAEPKSLSRANLLFHASFDETANADFAKGDSQIYTSETLKREKVSAGLKSEVVEHKKAGGRHGGHLSFSAKSNRIIFFKGAKNLPSREAPFEGTISFWMQLDADKDLPPGFVDPLQITDKKWNDASFFVDFTKMSPRTFRLGAYSNYAFWNPEAKKYDEIPDSKRPLISVSKLPFRRTSWTHVAITFAEFNRDKKPGVAKLYLDGELQGELKRPQRFTWKDDRLAIMLGIYYVGGIDDFAIFSQPLSAADVQRISKLPDGVKSLK